MPEDEDRDYAVGFGKPPLETRFKSGSSGNPKGRPKGVKNHKTMILELLNERITVTENGRSRQMTKAEAALRQQMNKALQGDPRAIRETFHLLRYAEGEEQPGDDVTSPSENDQIVWENLPRRIKRNDQ